MNIGIDIDGVLLDSEKVFRTAAELYNTIKLGNRAIRSYEEPRVQEKYNWTEDEIKEFADKYFIECSKVSNFMPYVKETINLLKKDGHKLIIITARGRDKEEMKKIAEEKFKQEGLVFDKYYWAINEKADICVKENIDLMIDDNYRNCLSIAKKGIKILYFRDTGIKKLEENEFIKEVHNWGEIYNYIKFQKNYRRNI